MSPPLITLEEHFLAECIRQSPTSKNIPVRLYPDEVFQNLVDIDTRRLKNMDSGDVAVQVISHLQVVEPLAHCRGANDQLAAAVEKHPSRFRGLAILPMGEPEKIAAELERCVKTHGFVGSLIPNHANGKYFDDETFWPMFAKAEELDVPLYLHPAPPTDVQALGGNYSDEVAMLLGGPAWGWHVDTGLHVIRLYASGLFDRYPRVKIIIGHMGEAMPFMCDRVERMLSRLAGARKRSFLEVWNENFWITTSGMFELGPLACLLQTVKPERILNSVDYPFESNVEGRDFMDMVGKSGMVSKEHLEMIAYKNAQALFNFSLV